MRGQQCRPARQSSHRPEESVAKCDCEHRSAEEIRAGSGPEWAGKSQTVSTIEATAAGYRHQQREVVELLEQGKEVGPPVAFL